MRTTRALLAALLLVGCIRTSTDPVTGRVDLDVESPTKQGEDWKARLTPLQGESITASVNARVLSGTTQATIQVTDARAGGVHPWHIHQGRCASGGPIVGPPAAYPPLTISAEGRATATAHLELQLQEAQRYHVNVHRSTSEMGTIIACGDLVD